MKLKDLLNEAVVDAKAAFMKKRQAHTDAKADAIEAKKIDDFDAKHQAREKQGQSNPKPGLVRAYSQEVLDVAKSNVKRDVDQAIKAGGDFEDAFKKFITLGQIELLFDRMQSRGASMAHMNGVFGQAETMYQTEFNRKSKK